jgi:hypothetical protein
VVSDQAHSRKALAALQDGQSQLKTWVRQQRGASRYSPTESPTTPTLPTCMHVMALYLLLALLEGTLILNDRASFISIESDDGTVAHKDCCPAQGSDLGKAHRLNTFSCSPPSCLRALDQLVPLCCCTYSCPLVPVFIPLWHDIITYSKTTLIQIYILPPDSW